MQNKSLLLLFLVVLMGFNSETVNAQRKSKKNKVEALKNTGDISNPSIASSPKLVVGIVVDQMRYDYLTRFWDQYGDGGFKRLVNDGFNCKNNHFNYAPTVTGAGHASVYTGTTPSVHGIIANDWYDKYSDESVYCAADDNYKSVGTTSNAGKMSPHRMQTTTITDQVRLHTQMRGKVIAVAIKDRGAVLPGGHSANAAYWFDGGDAGNWITSSYYMNELPKWVSEFNSQKSVNQYKKPWTTLKDINTYKESGADNNNYEGLFTGHSTPTFPYDLVGLWDNNGKYSLLKSTPYGNSLTTDFALEAVDKESLGADSDTDFLAISFSSTDYVGHKWGVNSKEVEDTYLRLDQDLKRLLDTLDKKVGAGEYTVFLTADHAAINVPAYLRDQKLPGAALVSDDFNKRLSEYLKYTFGTTDILKNTSNNQLFLDYKVIKGLDMEMNEVEESIAREIIQYDGIYKVFTANQMWQNQYSRGIPYIVQNGYNQKRSGEVLMVFDPGSGRYGNTGSTHGSPWNYDTHAPLLFYGKGIKKGTTVSRTEIPDIAPTIAALLGMNAPSGTTGEPIKEVIK
ncbi:alkaline phosphatase family protein [Arenibacter sp. BSSL-BM3]|uniref:Alkaline phosphatase family protein n=1 Tax=Arenibacter arenosicollis TaxID=2762274 RepID=A0ABR7QL02_9FLAO|nr:alkaline phosphatase PafA [Arenibacter arenosicollis]MBC8767642.1 alkaline phosphatase family protein [Arenibacter arenosicollis]